MLYGTEPSDYSTELEEAESDSDDTKNERGPRNTVTEKVRESRPILRTSPCHLCDCEVMNVLLGTHDLRFSRE